MTTHTRYIRHIVVLVTAVIGVGAGVGGVYASIRYLEQQTLATIDTQQRMRSYEGNKKIFGDESAALATIADRVAANETYIVTPSTMPTLLSSIEALAQTHNVKFVITSAQTPGKQKDKLTVDFSASGSLSAVTAFLEDLSHQTYQTKLAKLSLFADRSAQTGEWSALGSIQIISFNL